VLEVAIMIEGQNGLTWRRWQRIATLVEAMGFSGLYRSDHYTNSQPPDRESLELWVSLTWLASHTQRIAFGPLVSPVSFRHPTHTARMASAVDDLSEGRMTLGLGAGWQEREHRNYGWQLLPVAQRFRRFEEGLEIISRLLKESQPVSFEGEYFRIQDAVVLPRPQRNGGPPICIGGNGRRRTLPLVARYAAEWNALFMPLEAYTGLVEELDRLLHECGRQPGDVTRSMMLGTIFARNQAELHNKLGRRTAAEARARGVVCGTPNEIVAQLGDLAGAGVRRVMLQWLDLDDLDGLEAMASTVLPQVMR
jgi:F420-dependent oxidoreductase-like protein